MAVKPEHGLYFLERLIFYDIKRNEFFWTA